MVLYGCEAWTPLKKDIERLLAFEMKCYRRILHISWKDRVTNEKVREKVAIQKSQLLIQVKRLKLSYFEHTKRHPSLEKLILEGTLEGTRGRGRPRVQWVDNIDMCLGMSTVIAGGSKCLQKVRSSSYFT